RRLLGRPRLRRGYWTELSVDAPVGLLDRRPERRRAAGGRCLLNDTLLAGRLRLRLRSIPTLAALRLIRPWFIGIGARLTFGSLGRTGDRRPRHGNWRRRWRRGWRDRDRRRCNRRRGNRRGRRGGRERLAQHRERRLQF